MPGNEAMPQQNCIFTSTFKVSSMQHTTDCLSHCNDYTLDSGSNSLTLSFANGTANSEIKNAPIIVLDDFALEGTETIVLFAST